MNFRSYTQGRRLVVLKVHEGVYVFGDEDSKTRQALVFGFKSISVSDDEIMLWHHRLGHPSFPYLKLVSIFIQK